MEHSHPPILKACILAIFISATACGAYIGPAQGANAPVSLAPPLTSGKISGTEFGELEYVPIILEPTDFYLSLSKDLGNWKLSTVWSFEAMDPEEVSSILMSAGLGSEQAGHLTKPPFLTLNNSTKLFEIRPDEEAILNLSPGQRAKLYPLILPKSPHNPFSEPFALGPGGVVGKNKIHSRVSPGLIEAIDHMSFRQGHTVRFSDIRYILEKAQDDQERWNLMKIISREESLSVRLRVTNESDVDSLVKFWSAGGRNKEILPLLTSVISTPGVDTLDIVHLLPPTPRKHIHTFPSPRGEGLGDALPDCFWTAYSFFSENPPDRHLDGVAHVESERYEAAAPPYQLGDVVTISDDENKKTLHCCNILAGDLVFTKNGHSMGRPWSVTKLDRVIETYRRSDRIRVTFSRLKPEFQK